MLPTINSLYKTFDYKGITKEDCEKVLELLKTPTFNQMMSVLRIKESVIISSIAQLLDIEAQEVIDMIGKVLLL